MFGFYFVALIDILTKDIFSYNLPFPSFPRRQTFLMQYFSEKGFLFYKYSFTTITGTGYVEIKTHFKRREAYRATSTEHS